MLETIETFLAYLFAFLFCFIYILLWVLLFEEASHRHGEKRPVLKLTIVTIIVEIILFLLVHDNIIHILYD